MGFAVKKSFADCDLRASFRVKHSLTGRAFAKSANFGGAKDVSRPRGAGKLLSVRASPRRCVADVVSLEFGPPWPPEETRLTTRSFVQEDTLSPDTAGVFVKVLMLFLCALAASPASADPRADLQRAFEGVLAAGGFRGRAGPRAFGPGLPPLAGEVDAVSGSHSRTNRRDRVHRPTTAPGSTRSASWTPTDRSPLPVTTFDMAATRRAIAFDQRCAHRRHGENESMRGARVSFPQQRQPARSQW